MTVIKPDAYAFLRRLFAGVHPVWLYYTNLSTQWCPSYAKIPDLCGADYQVEDRLRRVGVGWRECAPTRATRL